MSLLLENIIDNNIQEFIRYIPDTAIAMLDYMSVTIDYIEAFFKYVFDRLPYNPLNRMIIYLILTFLLLLAILLPVILLSKLYITHKRNRYNDLYIRYSQYIIGFLIGSHTSEEIKDLEGLKANKIHRNVMIDVLMAIDKAENGDVSRRIRKLYMKLELDKDSIKKINKRAWNKKIVGIRELSHMRVKSENKKIIEFQQKSNEILRIETQIGLIKLLPFVPFAFLDSQEKPFTVWEQINVFDLIRKKRIEIPEFVLWLNHWNDSVVMFCLDMIRVLKQKEAAPKVMELLNHDNDLVKGKVIKTLVDLENREAVDKLKEIFILEELPNQINIIRSIGQLGMETELDFLEEKLSSKEFKIKMQACKSMVMIGDAGINRLKELCNDAEEELKAIVKHVLDPRI
ncbi:HEAT repeat domain-containing protein [Marinifilum sp. RC60d5]|uniref:HEAT repeat domain-containing protein n=1 Tax=Marinifilum sp. RC60d5 TaxID=3458414 RepID=UPI00403665C0